MPRPVRSAASATAPGGGGSAGPADVEAETPLVGAAPGGGSGRGSGGPAEEDAAPATASATCGHTLCNEVNQRRTQLLVLALAPAKHCGNKTLLPQVRRQRNREHRARFRIGNARGATTSATLPS